MPRVLRLFFFGFLILVECGAKEARGMSCIRNFPPSVIIACKRKIKNKKNKRNKRNKKIRLIEYEARSKVRRVTKKR